MQRKLSHRDAQSFCCRRPVGEEPRLDGSNGDTQREERTRDGRSVRNNPGSATFRVPIEIPDNEMRGAFRRAAEAGNERVESIFPSRDTRRSHLETR